MTDTVHACPECDETSDVHKRVDPSDDLPYYCGYCGANFETPVERERLQNPRKPDTLPYGLDPQAKELIKSIRGDE